MKRNINNEIQRDRQQKKRGNCTKGSIENVGNAFEKTSGDKIRSQSWDGEDV